MTKTKIFRLINLSCITWIKNYFSIDLHRILYKVISTAYGDMKNIIDKSFYMDLYFIVGLLIVVHLGWIKF